MKKQLILAAVLLAGATFSATAQKLPIDLNDGWELSWSDEFDYPNKQLDKRWISQNKASGGIVISSRWRENVVVKDGILELIVKKESRGGQDWTAGSIWTKEQFHYGYYECRYKYAGATGTNNSFWMWPVGGVKAGEKKYELDVNEGHYPATINTNFHNWTDKHEDGSHDIWPELFYMGKGEIKPSYSHEFKKGVKAQKIRFSSKAEYSITMGEFSIYEPNEAGYPVKPEDYAAVTKMSGLKNLARAETTKITSSQSKEVKNRNTSAQNVADGKGVSWVTEAAGDKWLEFDFGSEKEIGCIQFTNGWTYKGRLKSVVYDYKIEYFNGKKWVELADRDYTGGVDYSEEYHTYGMLWDKDKISYYFDGKLLRTHEHTDIISPTNIYLSLAVLGNDYAGAVTDKLDGKSMKVDYVRFYEYKGKK